MSMQGVQTVIINRGLLMQDLVQQAREVRRLIREVSLDSDASDLSLADFGLGNSEAALSRILGTGTAIVMSRLWFCS
jgi:hypothetical protein